MIPLALAATFLPEPRSPYTGPAKPQTASPIAVQADTFSQRFEPVYPNHTFAERWWPGDGGLERTVIERWRPDPEPEPLTFEQRWAPVEQTWGRRVRTIPIVQPPPEPRQEALEAIATAVPLPRERAVPPPRPKPRPTRVADICSKHGMHKQITNGGRSWRCRR